MKERMMTKEKEKGRKWSNKSEEGSGSRAETSPASWTLQILQLLSMKAGATGGLMDTAWLQLKNSRPTTDEGFRAATFSGSVGSWWVKETEESWHTKKKKLEERTWCVQPKHMNTRIVIIINKVKMCSGNLRHTLDQVSTVFPDIKSKMWPRSVTEEIKTRMSFFLIFDTTQLRQHTNVLVI